ncbi:DDE-type integrase/transposase/recombinase [Nereida sp. MMG025]|uniref:DDE-type integrase/transposase/recombinase n=1 Tax=Nereida sp. MMG025 TaxID=2909981 RepID=UPI00210482E4|nr:DDE-type integrase/transposase/recombinase [Nereida sp. MMG025]
MLPERGNTIDQSAVYRWVQRFGPKLTKRTDNHLRWTSLDWYVDETYIRVGDMWRCLWRAVDTNGLPLGTLRRNALPCSRWSPLA